MTLQSSSASTSTDWTTALLLLAVVFVASGVMGYIGWKKRDS